LAAIVAASADLSLYNAGDPAQPDDQTGIVDGARQPFHSRSRISGGRQAMAAMSPSSK
jgi:hypothetical protein